MAFNNVAAGADPEGHSADEAGGEAVFTSDGLTPLAAPLPPPSLAPVSHAAGMNDGAPTGDGDAVVEECSDPRSAFEAFAEAADKDVGGAAAAGGGGSWSGLSANNVDVANSSAWLDPRRRLVRLRAELDQLEAALAGEKRQSATDGAGLGDGDDDDDDDENYLRAATAELRSRLASLGAASGGDDPLSLATMLRGRQEDLSRIIVRDLETFGERMEDDLARAMGGLSLSKEVSNGGEDGGGRIVYELYRPADAAVAAAKASSIKPRELLLEERLRRLEIAVGTSSSPGVEGGSVMERIAEAERLSTELDPRQVEKLAAKAKVIRADLEAAARARAKLSTKSSSSNSAVAKEDSKVVAELHSQLVDLEGLSAHLPALAVRLMELSNLHANAAEFASRLGAAEESASRCEGVLNSVEEALKKMQKGWKDNIEGIERNVSRLDELLAGAQSS